MTNQLSHATSTTIQRFPANRRSITRFYLLFFHMATGKLYCCKRLHLTQVLVPDAPVDDFYYEDAWVTTHVEVLSRRLVAQPVAYAA